MTLSSNLQRSGYEAVTFHPFLQQMQSWFPSLQLRTFPSKEEMKKVLEGFDHFYIFFEKSPWMKEVMDFCLSHHEDKTSIINPIASPKTNYPYWETARFDGSKPFVDNLVKYCSEMLKLSHVQKTNGIVPLTGLQSRKYEHRVIIHPTSSREGKNWPKDKYLLLAKALKHRGYEPVFILTDKERESGWNGEADAPHIASLSELAAFIFESGWMIGNDSGIGHLSSCLGVPTVTICRSKMASNFWRPSWSPGAVVLPPSWIPNIKGLRWRDTHWKKWVSLRSVLLSFDRLVHSN